MSDVIILKIMRPPHSIHPSASVEESAKELSSQGSEALLIKQAEEYTGIFTKTDLIRLLEKNIDPAEVAVSTIMSKPVLSLDAKTTVDEARQKMMEKNIRHYAVTQNKKIVGLISIKDLNA
ncbi:MAG: CBS domain-containing protein [Nitrospinae bacterium]|nr:CBS domain-containing protein [Nitrospinota bacterium]MBL7020924.1 CBS domain-containing protein [Nitrospinaceae bacterium]